MMMKFRLIISSLLILIFTTACNFSLAADVTPPPGYQQPTIDASQTTPVARAIYPPLPPNPEAGAAIYAEKCAPCHGTTGLGNGPRAAELPNPVPALGSPEVSRFAKPADWYTSVTNGNLERFMPPFNSLTERQRWDVVGYALTLNSSSEELAEAAENYQENCASCHGNTGKGDGPQSAMLETAIPDLTSLPDLANNSLQELYSAISEGVSPGMPAFGELLSETERWTLSEYVRNLAFAAAPQGESMQETAATPIPEQAGIEASATVTTTTSTGTGIILGSITNASGGSMPDSLEISLHAFQDMTLVYSNTTQILPDGTYRFENVEMPEGRIFFTTTEFQDMIYRSERGDAIEGTTELDLPIKVYESTTDPASVSVDRLHLFPEFLGEETLRISEFYIISNTGQKTLVASETGQPVLEFDLPEGATNLQFQDDFSTDRFVLTEDGFGDLLPFVPGMGTYQLLYSYELPYDRNLDISQTMNLPVKAVLVAIPEDGIRIKGSNLVDGGTVEGQGGNFHVYNGQAINQGDMLELTISGRPSGGVSLSGGTQSGLLLGIAAFGLVLIGAGAWLYGRKRDQGPKFDDEELLAEPNGKFADRSEDVMDAILALDDLYKEGQLPEEAYLERRSELKARLKELLDREQTK